jgi:hypothetical protein
MEIKKQTAVDWVIEQLTPSISLQQKHIDELKEKAKEMEKKQIKDAYEQGDIQIVNGEQYYEQTYGGN